MTIHNLDNSRSQRVLWLLEELGIPLKSDSTSVILDRVWPQSYRIRPLGKSSGDRGRRARGRGIRRHRELHPAPVRRWTTAAGSVYRELQSVRSLDVHAQDWHDRGQLRFANPTGRRR
jgi:hypothetical protein